LQPEHFRLVKGFEMLGIEAALAIDLPFDPQVHRFALIPLRHQQRQRHVVAEDASLVDAMQLGILHVDRIAGDAVAGRGKVDELRQVHRLEAGKDAAQDLRHL
jgi:hypothetical protein